MFFYVKLNSHTENINVTKRKGIIEEKKITQSELTR